MLKSVYFPRWMDVPEVAQASETMSRLIRQHGELANSKETEDRAQARKIWTKLSSAWWDVLFALLEAQTQSLPDHLTFDESERLFIDLGFPGDGTLPVHKDFDPARVLEARCEGGMFSYFTFSDYIAECWSMIQGTPLPEPAIGLPVEQRIEAMLAQLNDLQGKRDEELLRIAETYVPNTPLNLKKLTADMNQNLMMGMKVLMRVPEYREAKESVRQEMSQARFRYAEAEEAILLMVSSAQKADANPMPLAEMEDFLRLHERTTTLARKILYTENDTKKAERRAKKITDACAQFPDMMKRHELRNMVAKKREYLSVPAKTARCDTSPLCPSSAPPIDYRENAAKLEAMSELDMDMFSVPRVRMYGIPRVIFIPGQGLSTYDWQDHTLLVPVFPVGGDDKSLSYALGTFRWDSDEERRLKTPYEQQIKENKKKSILALASSFYKDYFLWLTKEKQGYRILPRETRKVFEQMFAPRAEES